MKLSLNKRASYYLKILREINDLHATAGFNGASFNHCGKYGELILMEMLGATKPNRKVVKSKAVDIVLPDGRTVQVKTTNEINKEVTCTYTGQEPVDMMIILELNKSFTEISLLYCGPFKPFILKVNEHSVEKAKDNHRSVKKDIIKTTQKLFGFSEQSIQQIVNIKKHPFFIFE